MPKQSSTAFQTKTKDGVVWEISRLLEDNRLLHGFSTRLGGVSRGAQASLNLDHKQDSNENVRQNHLRLAAAIGYDARRLVSTHQVHKDEIRVAQPEDEGLVLDGPTPYECDALITNIPGRPLICYSADCIPILLWAEDVSAVAAIHAGWRGTAADIAAKCVQKLTAVYHAAPQNIKAAIGPGIGACCFSTHSDVPDALFAAFGQSAAPCIKHDPMESGKFLVDLKLANSLRLQAAGVPADNIALSPECTCCLPDKYWSHRKTGGKRGGQAAVIMLK